MPFVTEEIWQNLAKEQGLRSYPWDPDTIPDSIMVAAWPRPPVSWQDPDTENQFQTFLEIVAAIREIRSRQNIPPRQAIDVTLRVQKKKQLLLTPLTSSIEAMAMCSVVSMSPDAQPVPGSAEVTVDDCTVFIDLAELIDVDTEIDKLQRELEKLNKAIRAKRSKLGNEKFIRHAPPEIVQKEKDQLAEFEETRSKQDAILGELQRRKT